MPLPQDRPLTHDAHMPAKNLQMSKGVMLLQPAQAVGCVLVNALRRIRVLSGLTAVEDGVQGHAGNARPSPAVRLCRRSGDERSDDVSDEEYRDEKLGDCTDDAILLLKDHRAARGCRRGDGSWINGTSATGAGRAGQLLEIQL